MPCIYHIEASAPSLPIRYSVRAARGEFDAVSGVLSRSGLDRVKCLAFGEAVNVTLGLPIIRTL